MKNKVVLITGGNGTLGSAFTKGIAEEGGVVFILGRNEKKSDQKVEEFKKLGLTIYAVKCDVLKEDSVKEALKIILEKTGHIDVLINAAGGNLSGATVMPDESIFDLSMDQFRKVNDLNFMGTVIPSVVCAKAMVKKGKGCIINISSMAAQIPLTRVAGYSASKASVDNFTKWMAVEMASKYGEAIRVNAIAPGFFIADQNKKLLLNEDGTFTSRGHTIISQTPFKRFGKPEELISTVLWLCDDNSSFVNGIVVPVDGGFSAFSGV